VCKLRFSQSVYYLVLHFILFYLIFCLVTQKVPNRQCYIQVKKPLSIHNFALIERAFG